jgi:UDP-N-acetyl-D-mannosaminuronate dehydrogenase
MDVVRKYNPKRVLVVGLAYKPGQGITYKSPSLPFVDTLLKTGVSVDYYDPLVEYPSLSRVVDNDFNVDYLNNTFDVVCVCMKQTNVDYSVLEKLSKSKVVINY